MTTTPAITGTVSEGTLRPMDLVPAFARALEVLDPAAYRRARIDDRIDSIDDWYAEDVADLIADLQDGLHDALPEGWHFGTLEGDGACYGVWQDDPEWGEDDWG